MRSGTIILLFFLLFFSCKENKKVIQISEKDLDGYWVSGFLLHNTELSRSIASGNEKKPKVLLLRLKNSVNGFADTSFRIHGDTLFYRTGFKRELSNEDVVERPVINFFLIRFSSKDRLILKDGITHKEITYYNLNMVNDNNEDLKEITYGDLPISITDSVEIEDGVKSRKYNLNKKWKSDLNYLVRSINWGSALFTQESMSSSSAIVPSAKKNEIYLDARPAWAKLKVKSKMHFGDWNLDSDNVSDPAICALLIEMRIFRKYCDDNGYVQFSL